MFTLDDINAQLDTLGAERTQLLNVAPDSSVQQALGKYFYVCDFCR